MSIIQCVKLMSVGNRIFQFGQFLSFIKWVVIQFEFLLEREKYPFKINKYSITFTKRL